MASLSTEDVAPGSRKGDDGVCEAAIIVVVDGVDGAYFSVDAYKKTAKLCGAFPRRTSSGPLTDQGSAWALLAAGRCVP